MKITSGRPVGDSTFFKTQEGGFALFILPGTVGPTLSPLWKLQPIVCMSRDQRGERRKKGWALRTNRLWSWYPAWETCVIIVAWGGAQGRTGAVWSSSKPWWSTYSTYLEYLPLYYSEYSHAPPPSFSMSNANKNGEKANTRRESEATFLDHPQTSASIRIKEGKFFDF
ncbi:uncharacterized protein LAJ45_06209 [Morchella importuna]|uniref:uncharacterized protein n=1 Tax=Morchella importuna TaxID=1174673 RepID=UPI001E8DDB6F|nr:uncharacterized protein LAJ45_06209 [Morchella importuna]KAH8149580.1 hypothetical protein LAJ45_06209 [Morchella importuna]